MIRLLLLLMLLPFFVHADEFDIEAFAQLPVLHEGRIKPVDSFARLYFENDNAVEQLAAALFTPEKAIDNERFILPLESLRQILELPEAKERYSYKEVAPALDRQRPILKQLATKDANKYTANEKALWQLYSQVDAFAQITRTFSAFLPLEGDTGAYYEQRNEQVALAKKLKAIVKRKGEDITKYSAQEAAVALRSFALASVRLTGQGNALLKVLPTAVDGEWITPWQLIEGGKGTPKAGALMQHWQTLVTAYRADNANLWSKQLDLIETKNTPHTKWKLQLETFYNSAALIPKITLLYGFLFLLTLWGRFEHFIVPAFAVTLSLHSLVLLIRIALLGRPPVSTLYESVLFVALISAVFGFWLYRRKLYKEGLMIGALLGGVLLAVSDVYAGQSDTMGVLIAVLNTNIWLATHVICITIGYGASLVVGTLAHIALIRPNLSKPLPFLTVVALLFTAVGTILGGIWADQSWGRFWGWDPKENGALWIVLWLIWLLHGRMLSFMGRRGFAALLACTNIIVALSWFGVNLLGTGLHSYGFTDSAALGLFWFCVIELLIIFVLYLYPQFMKKKAE
ncbi:MAG: cytochrome c biogenesis protein CcsA [Rickettsiales bacterium]|nr:cytochrome c biogenesis protein CcsA [Rickettsiales bacterium]